MNKDKVAHVSVNPSCWNRDKRYTNQGSKNPPAEKAKRVLGVEENDNRSLYLECLLLDLSKFLGDDSSVI